MSKYTIGVDLAKGDDYSAYTVAKLRKIRWYHFWLKRLHLIKHLPSPIEIVDAWATPVQPQKDGDEERG